MWASAAHLYIPFDGLHQTTVRHLLRLRPTPFPAAMPRSQAASHHLIPIPRIGVWHQLCSGRAAAANGSGCSGRFLAFSHFSAPNQTGDVWGRRQNCTFQKSHISLFSLLFKAIFRLGNSPLTRRAKMPFKSETQAHRLSPPCMVPNVLKIWATACTYFNSFRCGQVKAGEPLSIQYKYCVAARLKDGITQQFWEKKTFAFLCLQPTVYVHGTYIGLKGDRSEERKIKREEGGKYFFSLSVWAGKNESERGLPLSVTDGPGQFITLLPLLLRSKRRNVLLRRMHPKGRNERISAAQLGGNRARGFRLNLFPVLRKSFCSAATAEEEIS